MSSKASTHSGSLREMPPRKMGNRTDAVKKMKTMTRIGTHDTNMLVHRDKARKKALEEGLP